MSSRTLAIDFLELRVRTASKVASCATCATCVCNLITQNGARLPSVVFVHERFIANTVLFQSKLFIWLARDPVMVRSDEQRYRILTAYSTSREKGESDEGTGASSLRGRKYLHSAHRKILITPGPARHPIRRRPPFAFGPSSCVLDLQIWATSTLNPSTTVTKRHHS